jgi:hypothetical protein
MRSRPLISAGHENCDADDQRMPMDLDVGRGTSTLVVLALKESMTAMSV